ncbi:hypothetical protein HWV62_35424 [Athelia sp. TMB]|nr:hypothetical protein HWV62_35424 [Athelia sp. TMB]
MDVRNKRMSFSSNRNESAIDVSAFSADADEWIKDWREVNARENIGAEWSSPDLIESPEIFSMDSESSVEDACDALLAQDINCLAVKDVSFDSYMGLFDFSDVNAFLTFAATRHTLLPQEIPGTSRVDQITAAAKAGRIPVHLVSNLSEKNPLEELPYDASILSLLAVFAQGRHRVLIKAPSPSARYHGIVSDRQLLAWFHSYSENTPSFANLLSNSLQSLSLPSINLYSAVVAATSSSTVLDAMKLMSNQGVSSVAVVDDETGQLLSAVSATDIDRGPIAEQPDTLHTAEAVYLVHQGSQHPIFLLARKLKVFQAPAGSEDGADRYPVYSVFQTSVLSYTIQKLLATNAHRLFVTLDASASPSAGTSSGNLSGIVSIVDILSLFARMARIQNVDPTSMQRHRRASSASSHSSQGPSSVPRSTSRTSLRQSLTAPGVVDGVVAGLGGVESSGHKSPPASSGDASGYQWTELPPKQDSYKGDI